VHLAGSDLTRVLRSISPDLSVFARAVAEAEIRGLLAKGELFDWDGPVPPRRIVTMSRQILQTARSAEAHAPLCLDVPPTGPVSYRSIELDRSISATPDLILDAYGRPEFYSALLGQDVTLHRIDTRIKAHHWWVRRSASRRAFADERLRRLLYSALARTLESLAFAGVTETETLIVTHKPERDSREFKEISEGCHVRHYGAGHGTNEFEHCKAVILFGVPRIPEVDVYLLTAALWPGVSYDDFTLYVDRVRHILIIEELAQQAHRIRPALYPGRIIVNIGDVRCPGLPAPWFVHDPEGIGLGYRILRFFQDNGFWAREILREQWSNYGARDYREIRRQLRAAGLARKRLGRRGGLYYYGDKERYEQWRQKEVVR
jgi:hypothetical protein